MVIEHLTLHAGDTAHTWFYRTVAGAELDLVMDPPLGMQAYEVKFGLSPALWQGLPQWVGRFGHRPRAYGVFRNGELSNGAGGACRQPSKSHAGAGLI